VSRPQLERDIESEWFHRVDNIISHKTEAEKILYEDDDFIMLPDFKWDLKDVNTLYLQAISRHKGIKSLRDIRYTHLGMLRQIRRQAHAVVEQFGVKKGELRLYVHYQPSYCQSLTW
jgi:m7GpppX diphosphatase